VSSGYGFVYLLGNKAMPGYYKIGCTERSPHARASELSGASGVPHPFNVLLYIEVADFQRVERRIHQELSDFRATERREFFRFGPDHMNWLWYVFDGHPNALSFASPGWHRYSSRPQFPDEHVETWIKNGEYLCMPSCPPIEGD
jgi:hypothetical protein